MSRLSKLSQTKNRKLNLETLESRQMMSATPSALPSVESLNIHRPTYAEVASKQSTSQKDVNLPQISIITHQAASSTQGSKDSTSSYLLGSAPSFNSFTATAISSTQAKLQWSNASNADGYVVDVFINGAWYQLGTCPAGTTNVTINGLTPGATYYFDVGAFNRDGVTWAPYQKVIASVPTQSLTAPTFNLTATSGTQVSVKWSPVAGANGYIIAKQVSGTWKQIGTVGAQATSYNVTGLTAGTTYNFKVAAYNASGTVWASPKSVTTTKSGPGPSGPTDPTNPSTVTVDHPTADGTYVPVAGTLFGSGGPRYDDVHQGKVGACWLMSSFAAVAARYPNAITDMFTSAGTVLENGQNVNLYKVRLYDTSGVAHYEIVDQALPQKTANAQTYAKIDDSGALWVPLAEKAYAQANGKGYVTTQFPKQDTYTALEGGDPRWAIQAITGKATTAQYTDPYGIAAAWQSGQIVCLGSSTNANFNLIVGGYENGKPGLHAYAMIGFNPSSSSPFELYNPWGATDVINGIVQFTHLDGSVSNVYGGAFFASSALLVNDFMASFSGGTSARSATPVNDSSDEISNHNSRHTIRHQEAIAARFADWDAVLAAAEQNSAESDYSVHNSNVNDNYPDLTERNALRQECRRAFLLWGKELRRRGDSSKRRFRGFDAWRRNRPQAICR